MFALTFNGRFELKDPEKFLEDLQTILNKNDVIYYGNIHSENLGEYVDFQKIDENIEETSNE